MTRFGRLLHLGNVVVDVVLNVAGIPQRGGDVLASSTEVTPGGGFNVIAAAVAQGLAVGYAGGYGSGPFAGLGLAALARENVEVLLAPKAGLDTGFVVTIVDAGGERTFLTSRGAEATLTARDLRGVRAGPRDAVYLSGYGLLRPGNADAILDWLGRLGEPNLLLLDPGPLVGDVPGDVLDRVLRRTDWLTCNAREAARLTGRADPLAAARALAAGESWCGPGRPGACWPWPAPVRLWCTCRASGCPCSTPTARAISTPGPSSPPWPGARMPGRPPGPRTRPPRSR